LGFFFFLVFFFFFCCVRWFFCGFFFVWLSFFFCLFFSFLLGYGVCGSRLFFFVVEMIFRHFSSKVCYVFFWIPRVPPLPFSLTSTLLPSSPSSTLPLENLFSLVPFLRVVFFEVFFKPEISHFQSLFPRVKLSFSVLIFYFPAVFWTPLPI